MGADAWSELEERLTALNVLSMPTNVAKANARQTLAEVQSGSGGQIEAVDFRGPSTFFRAVGMANRVYGGQWWFEEALLLKLDRAYSRIMFGDEKVRAVQHLLREGLALSNTWNKMTELWMLELPPGETLRGYRSRAVPQTLFGGLPVSMTNRMLVGGSTQIFFPVKNPFWVRTVGTLS